MKVRQGLFRLYVALSAAWVLWFGYVIFDAGHQIARSQDFINTDNNERKMGRRSPYDPMDLVVWQNRQIRRRDAAEVAILALPVGAPVFYLIIGWIISAFRRDAAG